MKNAALLYRICLRPSPHVDRIFYIRLIPNCVHKRKDHNACNWNNESTVVKETSSTLLIGMSLFRFEMFTSAFGVTLPTKVCIFIRDCSRLGITLSKSSTFTERGSERMFSGLKKNTVLTTVGNDWDGNDWDGNDWVGNCICLQ